MNEDYIKYKDGEISLGDLMIKNKKIIESIVVKKKGYLDEDCVQQGYIYMMEAIEGYKDNREYSVFTKVYSYINWKLSRFIYSDKLVRVPEYRMPETVKILPFYDWGQLCERQSEENIIENISMLEKFKKLSQIERDTIFMRSMGLNANEIGQKLGCCRSKITKILKQTRDKIEEV